MAQKDLLSRLADAGEEAIQRLASVPGTEQLLGAVTSMRDRMDEMQKRIRGIDALERRVQDLERRLDAMGGTGAASTTAQTGGEPPPLSTSASPPATSAVTGTAAGADVPPVSDVESFDVPPATGASLGEESGAAMPEPPLAPDTDTTTERSSAGDLGTAEPPLSGSSSVAGSAPMPGMAGGADPLPGAGIGEAERGPEPEPGSSTSSTGGDRPG